MASNRYSSGEDGVYLTPQDKLDEALNRRAMESSHVEEQSQRGYKIYSTSESTISNVSKVSEIDEVYVLPPQDRKPIKSQQNVSPRQKRKEKVEDIYDAEHYSLANPTNCVTQHAGVLEEKSEVKKSESEGKKRLVTKSRLKIFGLIVFLVCLGGISAVILTLFTGYIYQLI